MLADVDDTLPGVVLPDERGTLLPPPADPVTLLAVDRGLVLMAIEHMVAHPGPDAARRVALCLDGLADTQRSLVRNCDAIADDGGRWMRRAVLIDEGAASLDDLERWGTEALRLAAEAGDDERTTLPPEDEARPTDPEADHGR